MHKLICICCLFLFWFFSDCSLEKRLSSTQNQDLFDKKTLPISPIDKSRFFDCPENSNPNNMGLPFYIENKEFDYFSSNKYPLLRSGLIEINKNPVLLSMYGPKIPHELEKRLIVTFRGDTSGYHKSRLSKPYLEYMGKKRQKDMMLFLDEFIYRDGVQDLQKANLISICHSRKYLKTMMGANWPAVENGGGWDIVHQFFDHSQKVELFAYSNGTWPRTEFILRNFNENYDPNLWTIKDYPAYLPEYIANTKLAHSSSKNIYGIVDIEGNYFGGKPLWDLLAFVKEIIEPDPNRYYYTIVSVTEKNAFQNHIRIIQALELLGVEEPNGIVRYKNQKGNVIVDILTSSKEPHYEGFGFDLRYSTKFERHVSPYRIKLGHLSLIALAVKRFSESGHPFSPAAE